MRCSVAHLRLRVRRLCRNRRQTRRVRETFKEKAVRDALLDCALQRIGMEAHASAHGIPAGSYVPGSGLRNPDQLFVPTALTVPRCPLHGGAPGRRSREEVTLWRGTPQSQTRAAQQS
jgi:hypothetical protein